jgi:hypothetical protein
MTSDELDQLQGLLLKYVQDYGGSGGRPAFEE